MASNSASCTGSKLFSVSGKNILVTGSSRGIGLMIAKGFVRYGANVLITSRDENACKDATEQLSKLAVDGNIHFVTSNLSSREGCKSLASHARRIFNGNLDVLVNNAGASWGEDPYSRESGRANWGWDKVMDLNVKGIFYLTRELVPNLKRMDPDDNLRHVSDPGRVINIGSVTGFIPQEAPTHAYDISKAAVHHLTKKMAGDLAPYGITVNAIAPGYVPSRMSKGLSTWVADSQEIGSNIPLGRMGNEDDMAGAAIYLSSQASAWCTGVILNVDGGAIGATSIPLSSL
mmetsp:Transcript_2853/g.4037  ORF Transcript_2853/g.4037 Transcript_2853/m.4037 type:complete len:289 (-) Transcript_2853:214-1080(-)|eukprot:CAMPEP_0184866146 /NCGR_PEP_ID=MMETSP0580-20130426/21016_1 /TAXON_ID=1118495 /ORGANISM="Dactyliosolen fragilissimus" /LENGTH=288 /DNA_ID=CAMNT_0027365653 /DNA_START=62 /DNA_END=928 /DNA_ORIENTATION=-